MCQQVLGSKSVFLLWLWASLMEKCWSASITNFELEPIEVDTSLKQNQTEMEHFVPTSSEQCDDVKVTKALEDYIRSTHPEEFREGMGYITCKVMMANKIDVEAKFGRSSCPYSIVQRFWNPDICEGSGLLRSLKIILGFILCIGILILLIIVFLRVFYDRDDEARGRRRARADQLAAEERRLMEQSCLPERLYRNRDQSRVQRHKEDKIPTYEEATKDANAGLSQTEPPSYSEAIAGCSNDSNQ